MCSAALLKSVNGARHSKGRGSACFHIAPGRILDYRIAASAWHTLAFCGHDRTVLFANPLDPVGPPATFGFARAGHKFGKGLGRGVVAPELVFARIRWIDHTRDMARSREQEAPWPGQMPGQLPHAFGRRDMILAPGLDVAGCGDLVQIDRDTRSCATFVIAPSTRIAEIRSTSLYRRRRRRRSSLVPAAASKSSRTPGHVMKLRSLAQSFAFS